MGYNDSSLHIAPYSRLDHRLDKGSTYKVLVSSRRFLKVGDFTLKLEPMPLSNEPDTVEELAADNDEFTHGELTEERSDLWYRFAVSDSARHSIETSPPSSGSPADTNLELYRQKQNGLLLIDQNDDADGDAEDGSLDSGLSLHLERARYYVRVSQSFPFSLFSGNAERRDGFRIRVRRE